QGNLYFTDSVNSRVRRVTPNGTITTIAGNGTKGYCGDGGPAVNACLSQPSAVAVGTTGAGRALFIADSSNQRIRQVILDSAGTITTVAGNGTLGFSGDGGPAVNASLDLPLGVAF